jgi:ubiquinone/menaquinone biosynthesis C-methylase UbiE
MQRRFFLLQNKVTAMNRKEHWENIYQTKQCEEVSWYQPKPEVSLRFIEEYRLPLNAKIIDVGGGDSFLVEYLLERGYADVTVLDISEAALQRAQKRLGDKARRVTWIVADAARFEPSEQYDFWHDRAALHFLTDDEDIARYVATVQRHLRPSSGVVVIGAFSEQGPKKCSGIEIKQYSEDSMSALFRENFEKLRCEYIDHITPSGGVQNFVFCSFRKAPAIAHETGQG